jgi:hypothetical protein
MSASASLVVAGTAAGRPSSSCPEQRTAPRWGAHGYVSAACASTGGKCRSRKMGHLLLSAQSRMEPSRATRAVFSDRNRNGTSATCRSTSQNATRRQLSRACLLYDEFWTAEVTAARAAAVPLPPEEAAGIRDLVEQMKRELDTLSGPLYELRSMIAEAEPGTLEATLDDLVSSGVVSESVAAELRSGLRADLQDAFVEAADYILQTARQRGAGSRRPTCSTRARRARLRRFRRQVLVCGHYRFRRCGCGRNHRHWRACPRGRADRRGLAREAAMPMLGD